MGVRQFGMKISDQIVPATGYFSVKECDGLLGKLGGEFDGSMIFIDDINAYHRTIIFIAEFPESLSRFLTLK